MNDWHNIIAERAAFVPPQLRARAGQDAPLPIGAGQTTSQPSLVKHMVRMLDLTGGERVLEIGAGTGFAAAQIAQVASEVYTIERVPELAERARRILAQQGVDNVHVVQGDGARGLPAHAPYDGILVSAAAPDIPRALLEQLVVGGRLVIPVGEGKMQQLVRITRTGTDDFRREELPGAVRFVSLVRDAIAKRLIERGGAGA
jgi:protein-L-isoaspartate(D-aspartate) O-methyltransferase